MSFQNFRDPSTVHLVTASDPHHEHTQSGVLDAGDDAVIAYPVLPELAQLGTLEGLPDATRIVQRGNAAMQKGKDVRLQRKWDILASKLRDGWSRC